MTTVDFDKALLKQLYVPPVGSHKGQNGKLLIVGGSRLFHAASLWALDIASRIVDMVFYASVPENNMIVQRVKEEFRNGIVIPRDDIDSYAGEADCILVGPGLNRSNIKNQRLNIINRRLSLQDVKAFRVEGEVRAEPATMNKAHRTKNVREINRMDDEGEQTYYLTKYLLDKYPDKKFVIDAGALQMMEPERLLSLSCNPILTPHSEEFGHLFGQDIKYEIANSNYAKENIVGEKTLAESAQEMAGKYNCVILLKGQEDVVCSPGGCCIVKGGNAGMTKGGTGDVLAGLTAALYCKNEAYLSACSASYFNKKSGESLFGKVGYYYNASDLAAELPGVIREELQLT